MDIMSMDSMNGWMKQIDSHGGYFHRNYIIIINLLTLAAIFRPIRLQPETALLLPDIDNYEFRILITVVGADLLLISCIS